MPLRLQPRPRMRVQQLWMKPRPRRRCRHLKSEAETPLQVGPVSVSWLRLFALGLALLLIAGTYVVINRTKLGRAMRATFQDSDTAALMGVNIRAIHTATFAICSALAAAAGALLGPVFLVEPTMGDLASLKAFAIVILGGLGNVTGAAIGGFVLALVEEMGAKIAQFKDTEQELVRALGDALNRVDQRLLQNVREITSEHGARRSAMLHDLQGLAARIGSFPTSRRPMSWLECEHAARPFESANGATQFPCGVSGRAAFPYVASPRWRHGACAEGQG